MARRRTALYVATVGAVLWILSCDERGDGAADADVDADAGVDADVDGDADGGSDADVDGDEDVDADGDGETRAGNVTLVERETAGVFSNSATVSFSSVQTGFSGRVCGVIVRELGEGNTCTIESSVVPPTCDPTCIAPRVCVYAPDCSAGECVEPATTEPLQAGVVTVAGAAHQNPVTCMYDEGTGVYVCDVAASNWWDAGDLLTVSAPGGSFPAFTVSIAAPDVISLVTDIEAWTLATFDGSTAVPVEWTAGAGRVLIGLTGVTTMRTMTCTVDDDGAFALPAELIAALGDNTMWSVSITRISRAVANEGVDGQVTVTATPNGVSRTIL